MEANEAQELQEHAEHGSESGMRPVAFTMAVLAVLVAVVTVLGHRRHTEAVLNQAKASDTWNEYQAKKNRAYDTALVTDLLSVVTVADANAAKKTAKGYADHQAKWAEDLAKKRKRPRGWKARSSWPSTRPTTSTWRGAAGDRAGGHVGHAAHAPQDLLVYRHGVCAGRRGVCTVGAVHHVGQSAGSCSSSSMGRGRALTCAEVSRNTATTMAAMPANSVSPGRSCNRGIPNSTATMGLT